MKKIAAKSQRASKEVSSVQPRARRLMREALIYWRRYERVEREQRKKAEKEATEQNKLNQEMMEVYMVVNYLYVQQNFQTYMYWINFVLCQEFVFFSEYISTVRGVNTRCVEEYCM